MSEAEAQLMAGRGRGPIVVEEPLTLEQVKEALEAGRREREAAERVTRGRRTVRR